MKNSTKPPFLTEFNFLKLLLAIYVINKYNNIIDKSELEHELYWFYDKSEFHFLFIDICKKESVDNSYYVDLSCAFQTANELGLINIINDTGNNIKFTINMSEEEAKIILKNYSLKVRFYMLKLFKKLKQEAEKNKFDYIPSNDSENIAELLKNFVYDPSKTEEILLHYDELIKSESASRILKPKDK